MKMKKLKRRKKKKMTRKIKSDRGNDTFQHPMGTITWMEICIRLYSHFQCKLWIFNELSFFHWLSFSHTHTHTWIHSNDEYRHSINDVRCSSSIYPSIHPEYTFILFIDDLLNSSFAFVKFMLRHELWI